MPISASFSLWQCLLSRHGLARAGLSRQKNNARQLNRRFWGTDKRRQEGRAVVRMPRRNGGSPIRQCPYAMHANSGRTTQIKRSARWWCGGHADAWEREREGKGVVTHAQYVRTRTCIRSVVNADRRRGRFFQLVVARPAWLGLEGYILPVYHTRSNPNPCCRETPTPSVLIKCTYTSKKLISGIRSNL
jgi:hypothetical protein